MLKIVIITCIHLVLFVKNYYLKYLLIISYRNYGILLFRSFYSRLNVCLFLGLFVFDFLVMLNHYYGVVLV